MGPHDALFGHLNPYESAVQALGFRVWGVLRFGGFCRDGHLPYDIIGIMLKTYYHGCAQDSLSMATAKDT